MSKNTTLLNVLIIDTHKTDIQLMEESLADGGIASIIHKMDSIAKAIEAAKESKFDIAIVELGTLKGEDFTMASESMFDSLAKLCDQCKVIVCSISASMEHVHHSFQAGAEMYFYKPIMHDDYSKFAKLVAEHTQAEATPTNVKIKTPAYTKSPNPITPGSNGFRVGKGNK